MTANVMPFDLMFDRMRTLSRAMDDALRPERATGTDAVHWIPSVDVYQTDEEFVVEADLPGVRAEELDLDYERHVLTIRGERARRESETPRRLLAAERLTGRFARAIRLPDWVDAERIDASFEQGVLRVRLPKAVAARARKIPVRGPARPEVGGEVAPAAEARAEPAA